MAMAMAMSMPMTYGYGVNQLKTVANHVLKTCV